MANMAEGLARELVRVTELREQYRSLRGQPQVIVEPALVMLDASIEEGCAAAGSNDVVRVITAYTRLKEHEK